MLYTIKIIIVISKMIKMIFIIYNLLKLFYKNFHNEYMYISYLLSLSFLINL